MKFEEQFPSIKPEYALSVNDIALVSGWFEGPINNDFFTLHGTGFIGQKHILKHCLDKARVKEAIERAKDVVCSDSSWNKDRDWFIETFEKEMGL